MPRKVVKFDENKWSADELIAVKHLGPAIIGEEMHAAAQALQVKTAGGIFGPAMLADSPEDVERIRAELNGQ